MRIPVKPKIIQQVHLNLPVAVWIATRHGAVERGTTATEIVVLALKKYLKLGA